MFVGCSFDSQVIGGSLRGTVQRYMWQHRVELVPAQPSPAQGKPERFLFREMPCHLSAAHSAPLEGPPTNNGACRSGAELTD